MAERWFSKPGRRWFKSSHTHQKYRGVLRGTPVSFTIGKEKMSEKIPIRKSMLPHGPWADEPDEKVWEHEGLACVIVRGPFWSFNGYVGIDVGHVLFGLNYGDKCPMLEEAREKLMALPANSPKIGMGLLLQAMGGEIEPCPETMLRVHGGITYAGGRCPDDPKERTGMWWFGFDTGHCNDFAPGLYYNSPQVDYFRENTVYRDLAYVTQEVNELAEQLVRLDKLMSKN